MAWSSSGLFVATQMDQWDDTGLGIDLTSESALKAAFWGSSVTPNFDQTGAAYGSSPWNSGEASGAGYSAGGIAVTGTTLAIVSGSLRFDADNFLIDNSTITAEGYLLYVWFGEPKSTEDGAFLVTHDPTGIAILDCVP
jgi:hypothetical protein